jgi:transcriptional regulator with XRE-family HTH domain
MTILDDWKSAKGVNDTQASEMLGISRGFFVALRRENALPSVPVLIRMRRVTGLSFDDLLKKWVEEDAREHAEKNAPGTQLSLPQLPNQSGVAA